MEDSSEKSVESGKLMRQLHRLLERTVTDEFDSLECPQCHQPSLSIWFTPPRKDHYRTSFVCSQCQLEARDIDRQMAGNYWEERMNRRLHAYDAELLQEGPLPAPRMIPIPSTQVHVLTCIRKRRPTSTMSRRDCGRKRAYHRPVTQVALSRAACSHR